jgi:alpha-galactosidase
MKAVVDYIHGRGLLAGIYTDAGGSPCSGGPSAAGSHYQEDANQFAAWGFDAVKVDFLCGHRLGLDPATAYSAFANALLHNSSHRPMLFNICNPFHFQRSGPNRTPYTSSSRYSYAFGPHTGNSWRTDGDIGVPGRVTFDSVLRNLDADAVHPEAAGPGHWNDPDYLAPGLGMSNAAAQTQFTMWSMLAAPLILGNDIRSMSPVTQTIVTNPEVIAIDQDPLGVQGRLVARRGKGAEVWVRPLADGERAVTLLNRGRRRRFISISAGSIGLAPSERYDLRNVWAHETRTTSGTIARSVRGSHAVLYRVSAAK